MISHFRLSSKLFATLAVFCFGLFFVAQFNAPYRDHDPLSYILIGRGMYQYGIMPYGFAFDHKPFLLYAFYGLLSYIDPRFYELKIFTLAVYLVTGYLVYAFYLKRKLPFYALFLLLNMAAIGIVGFSGNSEIIYIILEFACLYFALNSKDRETNLVLSAVFAVAAVNTNYICGFALTPALVYVFYAQRNSVGDFLWRTLRYGIYGVVLLLLMIGLMYALGTDIPAYFTQQLQFLRAYSDAGGGAGWGFLLRLFAFLPFAILPFLPMTRPLPEHRVMAYALVIVMAASTLSFVLSGKYYPHYIYMVSYPAILILILTLMARAAADRLISGIIACLCVFYIATFASFLVDRKYPMSEFLEPYRRITATVGQDKVLTMRAAIVPTYYSGLYPFQPLTWYDHAKILYGAGEDGYFKTYLDLKPKFVLTEHDWCADGGAQWVSCQTLRDGYTRVIAYEGEGNVPSRGRVMVGYDLYAIRP